MGYVFRPVLGYPQTIHWNKKRRQNTGRNMEDKVKATIWTRPKTCCEKLNKCDLLTGKHSGMASINAANTSQYYSISQYKNLQRQIHKAIQHTPSSWNPVLFSNHRSSLLKWQITTINIVNRRQQAQRWTVDMQKLTALYCPEVSEAAHCRKVLFVLNIGDSGER